LEQRLGDLLSKEHPGEGEIVAQIESMPESRDHEDTVTSKDILLGVSLGFSFTADSEVDVVLKPNLRSRVPTFNSILDIILEFDGEGSDSNDLAVLFREGLSSRVVVQARSSDVSGGDHPSRIVSASLDQHGGEQIEEFVSPAALSIRRIDNTIGIVFGSEEDNDCHEEETRDQISERSKEGSGGFLVGFSSVDEVVVIKIFTSGTNEGVGIEIHERQVFKEAGELDDFVLVLACRELFLIFATILITPGQGSLLAHVNHQNRGNIHLVTTPINPHSVNVEDGKEAHREDENKNSFVSSKIFHDEINHKSHSQWVQDISFVDQELEGKTKTSSENVSNSGVMDSLEDETKRIRDQKTENHLNLVSRNTNSVSEIIEKMINTESHN